MHKPLTQLHLLGKKIHDFFEKNNITAYSIEKRTGIYAKTVKGFTERNDISYSQIVRISAIHPDFYKVFFSEKGNNSTNVDDKNTSPPILQKAENYIRVSFQNHIIPIGDTIGTSATTTSTTIDTARIYYIVTRTTTLIKYLERDPTDASILHCHTPSHPSFTISISDIQELHLVIFKISSL